jgi:hypothetical protein
MDMLARVTPSQIAHHEGNQGMKMAIAEVSLTLTMEVAFNAPKITQFNRLPDNRTSLKLLVAILRVYVDSIRVERKLDPGSLLILADDLLKHYPLASLEDFILAAKDARSQRYFNKIDESDIHLFVAAYFEKRAKWHENKILDLKAQSTSIDYNAMHHLKQVCPKLVEHLSLHIDPSHPNATSQRHLLSRINNLESRGLISPKQARIERAALAASMIRKSRRDWGQMNT